MAPGARKNRAKTGGKAKAGGGAEKKTLATWGARAKRESQDECRWMAAHA